MTERIERVSLPILLVLASLAAVAPVATDLYLPGFPSMSADLGVGASGVQITLTTFLAGQAFGQLVFGPLSDRYGRRRPLLLSAGVCVLAGGVCAVAPSLTVLALARLLQGFTGAGGMVIGRAVISDLVSGRAAARAFTLMLTVGGIAPVLAPLVGGLLVGPIGWRGLLWTVTAICTAMLIGVVFVLHETHPAELRTTGSTVAFTSMRTAISNPAYRGPVAVFALSFGMLMTYIASSPFVYQKVVGLSQVAYGAVFGVNAAGLIAAGWVTSRLIDRWSPSLILRSAILIQVVATLSLVLLAVMHAPTWILPLPIFVAVVSNGGVLGNAAALAMAQVRHVAGAGSAVLGFSQFALGALVSPLAGLGGAGSALVPAIVMATCSTLALLATGSLRGQSRSSSTAIATS